MLGFDIGGPEAIIVLIIVLVLFGGSQIPKLARNLGRAQKEFKDGIDEGSRSAAAGFVAPCRQRPSHGHDGYRRANPQRRQLAESVTGAGSPEPTHDRQLAAIALRRRRFRMRRRSRSLQPPHTP